MKFFGIFAIVLALIAAVLAAPQEQKLVGATKCTYGPSYWCASKENAQQCGNGAVQHCETKVWNKN